MASSPAAALPVSDVKQSSPVTNEGLADGRLLITDKLVKEYRNRRVVNGVSVSVAAGEIVGLLGPNGAGKTTTMRMLTTFLQPTSGRASKAADAVW